MKVYLALLPLHFWVPQSAINRFKNEYYNHGNSQLDSSHQFEPVAIETTGVIGERSRKFLVELGCRIRRVSGEVNSTAFLLQRLSIAVQRWNAASVLGTIGSTEVSRVVM